MIVLQFSTTSGLFAKITDWFTQSDYSHVDVVLPDGRLLGSQRKSKTGSGVQIRQPNYEKFSRTKRFAFIAPSLEWESKGVKWLFAQIGKPYDMTAIEGFALGRKWYEDDSWFCSELTEEFSFQCGNRLLGDDGDRDRVTPGEQVLSPNLYSVDDNARSTFKIPN